MSFMVDLRIDIRTEEMLDITPCLEVLLYIICLLYRKVYWPLTLNYVNQR